MHDGEEEGVTTPKYEAFKHPEATSPMRPDVGTQAAFKKKKPPVTYRYDSSLSPALDWDGQNPAREQGEAILAQLDRAARRDPGGAGGPASSSRLSATGCPRLRRMRRADRPAQGHVAAVPQLGGQGRAALVRRAHAAALRPRAALDQGDHRDAARAQARQAHSGDDVRALRRPAATRSPTRSPGPTSTRTTGSTG